MRGELLAGERSVRFDEHHETEPGANRAIAAVVPCKSFRRPVGRVRGQHEIEKFLQAGESVAEYHPVAGTRRDERGQFLELLAADRGLDVQRLEVVAEVRINVFVVVAFRQFAQLPAPAFVTGVVRPAGAPAVATPITET